MLSRFKDYFLIPTLDAQQKTRSTELLKSVSLGGIGVLIIGGVVEIAFLPASIPYFIANAIVCLVFLVSYLLARWGRIHAASLFLTVSLWIAAIWISFSVEASGILGFTGYLIVLLVASLFFNERVGLLFFWLIVLVNVGAMVAKVLDYSSYQSKVDLNNYAALWAAQAILFLLVAFLLRIAFRALRDALYRAQENEQHLARRAMQIQAAAEVSRDATAVREMDELLKRAVELISERFGFYYASIYIVDEPNEFVILRAASGEAGRELLKRGHKLRIGKEGMIGYVANSGQPRVALDVGTDVTHFKNPLLPHTRSEMSLPLIVKQRVLGVLDVQSKVEAAFSTEDAEVLQTMADQLAMVYETARLFEAAQRQLRELTVLHAVACASTQTASEDALIERVTQIIGDAFYPDNFGLILVEEKSGLLQKHPSYREIVNVGDAPYPIGTGITGRVAEEGHSWRVGDVSKEPDYFVVDPDARSELCVPVKIGERVVGVLNTESTQLDAFTEADERLLVTVAGHLALALENARLFEAEHRLSADLEALRQANLHLTSSLVLESVLETILEQAMQLVAADYSRIYLFDGEQLTFAMELHSDRSQEDLLIISSLDAVAGIAFQTRQKTVVSGISDDPLYTALKVNGAIICFPMCIGVQLLGVIGIQFSDPNAFDQNDLRILELFADQAALTLANAHMFVDIQSHAQELTQALTRLREMDRLKNEFIQNVSHELRTPIAVVLGYSELLESGELGDLKPEQHGPISVITRRLQELSMILEDFLIILEIETHDQPFELVDLTQVLSKTVMEVTGSVAQAGISLRVHHDPDIPHVRGISDHLRHAIHNLIGNAIKFTPAGGSIEIQLHSLGNEVILEVSDTGIGIHSEQLPRIFDRFYQVDGSSTRRYGGIGLGLALVKEVIEAQGGHILVESKLGEGSTFRLILPAGV